MNQSDDQGVLIEYSITPNHVYIDLCGDDYQITMNFHPASSRISVNFNFGFLILQFARTEF